MRMRVLALAAMPTMHEKMQRQTGKQQQKEQRAEQMGAMLGQQKKRRDGEQSKHCQVCPASACVPGRSGKMTFHGVTFAYGDQVRACW